MRLEEIEIVLTTIEKYARNFVEFSEDEKEQERTDEYARNWIRMNTENSTDFRLFYDYYQKTKKLIEEIRTC